MIQIGEVRRYHAGERVPWWCEFQRPHFGGWPRFGRITFGCDVEVSLDRELRIHIHPVSEGDCVILISRANHMNIGPPGRGARVHIHPVDVALRAEG